MSSRGNQSGSRLSNALKKINLPMGRTALRSPSMQGSAGSDKTPVSPGPTSMSLAPMAEGEESAPQVVAARLPVIEDDHAELIFRFNVLKVNKFNKKQKRVWSISYADGYLRNIDMNQKCKKQYHFTTLREVGRSNKDPRLVRLNFADRAPNNPYLVYFVTTSEATAFLEKLWGLFDFKCLRDLPHLLEEPEVPLEETTIFVGTWNLGDAPPPESLSSWLPQDMFDIYAIGAQECGFDTRQKETAAPDDASAAASAAGSSAAGSTTSAPGSAASSNAGSSRNQWYSQTKRQWINTLSAHLGDRYTLVCVENMWSIRLCVFVKSELVPYITRIESATEATGIGHVCGNKGGVAVSFLLNQTPICFVTCHLAARKERLQVRRENIEEIIGGINVGCRGVDFTSQYNVFWFGDLNYRLDLMDSYDGTETLDNFQKTIALIDEGEYDQLYEHDQLRREMLAQNVFRGFREGPPTFAPTYRYERNSTTYSNKRNQSPSWCDRILWRSMDGFNCRQISYGASEDIQVSDHRPVFSFFHLDRRLAYEAGSRPVICCLILKDLVADLNKVLDPVGALAGVRRRGSDIGRRASSASDSSLTSPAPPALSTSPPADGGPPTAPVASSGSGAERPAMKIPDPETCFFSIYSPMLGGGGYESSPLFKTTQPMWKREDSNTFVYTFTAHVKWIMEERIFLAYQSQGDLAIQPRNLGHCTLPLRGACNSVEIEFEAPLIHRAIPVGTVRGQYHLKFQVPLEDHQRATI